MKKKRIGTLCSGNIKNDIKIAEKFSKKFNSIISVNFTIP